MSVTENDADAPVEFIFLGPEERSSSGEPPPSEWASLEVPIVEENKKRALYRDGLYSPGSGEICTKYIAVSDSSIFRHLYYNYPGVSDPGIKEALLSAEPPVIFPDDGQALYLHLCKEMNAAPVRMFYKSLLNSSINLNYYGISWQGVRAMAKALEYNKFVTHFDLTGNFLNDDACYHLGRMLNANTTLTELILYGCRIGASGIFRLGDTLRHNKTLMFLDIGNNELHDDGGTHFAQQIYEGAIVKRVNLSKNHLGRLCALALADVWEWKNKFTYLDLSWNNFYHVPSTVKMLDQLACSLYLEKLILSYNSLQGDRVANALCNVMLVPTLTKLDLSHNLFQGEAVEIITTGLLQAKKLSKLNLSFNPLSPHDAYTVLQKMLRPRIKINRLLMKGVCVKKPFVELLARVKKMKTRKNFICKFDRVLENWTIEEPDGRKLILERAQYLGRSARKNKIDTALYFLALAKELERPIAIKDLVDRLSNDNVALDEDLINELSWVFPGPKTPKSRTIDFKLIMEFIHRLWPDKRLPPTPPPEPEPVPEEAAPPTNPKGKKGKK